MRALSVALLCLGSAIAGALIWPIARHALREVVYPVPRDRAPIACPPQTASTMVIVALGQSNAANGLGQRYVGRAGVVNFFKGACYAARDPLLGSSNEWGSLWVALANRLEPKDIVIVALGIDASTVKRWSSGDLNRLLRHTLRALPYRPTHFLWQQGEADASLGTKDYAAHLAKVIDTTREFAPQAGFWIARSTVCNSRADNTVRAAQLALVSPTRRIYAGPDTDQLTAIEDRYDGCHFSMVGQEKVAAMWAAVLR